MKTFFLIVAFCASVAVATPDVKLNEKVAICLKQYKWTVERLREKCNKLPSVADPEFCNFFNMLACIYKEADIVYQKISFGPIVVSATNAGKLVPPEDSERVIQAVKGCKGFVRATKYNTVLTAAYRLHFCLYKNNTKLAVQTCISLIAGVELGDEKASIDEVKLDDRKDALIEWDPVEEREKDLIKWDPLDMEEDLVQASLSFRSSPSPNL